MQRVEITITGRVQGVGFRYFVKHHAQMLDIKGYARNVDYDKVEVVAEGRKDDLDKLVELCRKGPTLAWVENISHDFSEAGGEFKRFEIG